MRVQAGYCDSSHIGVRPTPTVGLKTRITIVTIPEYGRRSFSPSTDVYRVQHVIARPSAAFEVILRTYLQAQPKASRADRFSIHFVSVAHRAYCFVSEPIMNHQT